MLLDGSSARGDHAELASVSVLANRSRSPRVRKVKCSIVPLCTNPRKDYATPLGQLVSNTTAARLRQRSCRGINTADGTFPWNEASRAAMEGRDYRVWLADPKRGGCVICPVINSRNCCCGMRLAAGMDASMLTSFITFVRLPTTPVWDEADPEDQGVFKNALTQVMRQFSGEDGGRHQVVCRSIMRFAAVMALSGRPEIADKPKDFWGGHVFASFCPCLLLHPPDLHG